MIRLEFPGNNPLNNSVDNVGVSHPDMRNNLGFALQFGALVLLPLLILWQLKFGFELLYMPMLTLAGAVVFWIGHRLREPSE